MVNTAILTSRQVSEPLRVFMVTQAGKVADVTLQASCSSVDESVLKVLQLIDRRKSSLPSLIDRVFVDLGVFVVHVRLFGRVGSEGLD